jgi:serine-type D-Ala-D-Ala carboxypeptidase/endopeptidase (penicillin-binding protein 4)
LKGVALVIALFMLPFQSIPVQAEGIQMEQQIREILQSEEDIQGAVVGLSVRSAETGKSLYEHNSNIRLRPASNMKLFTAAAALSVLGEDYTFKTEVVTDGKIDNGVLRGNLYLVGKGDPTLLKEDFDKLAEDVKNHGITRVEGDLIGDDSWYDDVRLSTDMIWSDEHFYYGAQISALSASPNRDYDAGTVLVEVMPGSEVGQKANISITPSTNYVNLINRVTTVDEEIEADIIFNRVHGSNTIIVEGKIPYESDIEKEFIAVWEPTGYALDLFAQSLMDSGVQLKGDILSGTAKEETKLAVRESMPLSKLLVPFMKLSNNVHAEILVKELGKAAKGEGSWDKGLEVIKEQLEEFGINHDTFVIRDGSGISNINLITANEVSRLLFLVQDKPWFKSFLDSLPVAGKEERMEGGTLRNRMAHLDVRAKTGTLLTVTSLSGYTKTNSGKELIFSILINNVLDEEKGKDVEDKLVQAIVNQ